MTRKRVPARLGPLAIAPLGMGRPWCYSTRKEGPAILRYSRGHSPPPQLIERQKPVFRTLLLEQGGEAGPLDLGPPCPAQLFQKLSAYTFINITISLIVAMN